MARGITRDTGKDMTGGRNIQGSPNVFANNRPVVRLFDKVQPHGPGTHGGPRMASGSPNAFTNNKKTCRRGDVATCGHRAIGSSDTFVN